MACSGAAGERATWGALRGGPTGGHLTRQLPHNVLHQPARDHTTPLDTNYQGDDGQNPLTCRISTSGMTWTATLLNIPYQPHLFPSYTLLLVSPFFPYPNSIPSPATPAEKKQHSDERREFPFFTVNPRRMPPGAKEES